MPWSEEENWRDVLAEQHRQGIIRDAVAKELARTYGPVAAEPLPPEFLQALEEQSRNERGLG